MSHAACLGIDLGTSGCRGIAISADGRVLAQSHTSLPPPQRSNRSVEQEPQLWWRAVKKVIADILLQLGDIPLGSIAVDGTSGTLLLCDQHGQPLSPGLMYNDARAVEEAKAIAGLAPENTAATGPSSALAKLLWLQSRMPMEQVSYALHQADWISNRLCGHYGQSDINNCMKLGYDAEQKVWPQWLHALGVESRLLPEVLAPGSLIGQLDPVLMEQFALTQPVNILAGTTDSTAAIYASGACQPGDAITSLGSTLVTKIVSERPIFDTAHGVYSQPFGRYWLVGGASNSGGSVLLKYFDRQQLAEMTPQLSPEQETGLDFYPLCEAGERFPVNDPDYAPRLQPRPESDIVFFQAMLEGMAGIEQQAYELLHRLGAPRPKKVLSLGGGTVNQAWTEIRKKRLNIDVISAEHTEAAYGTAMIACHNQTR